MLSIRLVLKHILKGKRDTRGEFCSLNVLQCLTAIIYSTKTFAKAAYGINKKDSNLFMELFWYVAKQLSLTSDKWKHIVLGWNTSKMIKSINEMKLRLYSFKKKCCSMLICIKKIFVFIQQNITILLQPLWGIFPGTYLSSYGTGTQQVYMENSSHVVRSHPAGCL